MMRSVSAMRCCGRLATEPLLMLGWFAGNGMGLRWPYLALALLTSALVIWRHRSNLERLLAGTEPKLGQPKQAQPKS